MTGTRYPVLVSRGETRARFEAAGQPDALMAALQAAGLVVPARANTCAHTGSALRVDWLGPRRCVVSAPMDQEDALDERLHSAFATVELAAVCRTSDMVVSFELAGPGAPDLLAQGGALDFSDAAFAVGNVTGTDLWGIAAVVERSADAPGSLRVTVDRSLAGFVEGWLLVANGQPSSLRPGVMRTAHGPQSGAGEGTEASARWAAPSAVSVVRSTKVHQ